MKYSILTYEKRPMRPGGKNRLNIGDPIQKYAMKHIYNKMNIKEEDIIPISRYHAKEYDGEEVILPFNCFNRIYNQLGRPYGTFPLSKKIVPVFLSFHLHTREISEDILETFRAYQPIGCRDEETMINMKNHGLNAYLSGCVTALLPRREIEPRVTKTLFIDIPSSVEEYIPEELKSNAEYLTHHILLKRSSDDEWLTEEEYERFYNLGVSRLEQYKEEATLVVTSRLHAAIPCMAMGIPVILVGNDFDNRFSWVDKYLPLYTPDVFDKIDWNPHRVEYEEEKEKITNFFISQISNTYNLYNGMNEISMYYQSREKTIYDKTLRNELSKLPIAHRSNVKYGIWGLATESEKLVNLILDSFSTWKLEIVIDSTSDGEFYGVEVKKSKDIVDTDSDIIYFIVPESAHNPARTLLNDLGRDYILLNGSTMTYINNKK